MTNNNSENLDRIDTGELEVIKVDQVSNVTDESVAGETLVVNAEIEAEAEEVTEAEAIVEDAAGGVSDDASDGEVEIVEELEELAVEEDSYPHVQLPRIRRGFRGYNVEDIDNFVLPLIDSYNELQETRKNESEYLADLVAQAEQDKETIESLRNFVLTDEVNKVLEQAHEDAKAKILVAEEEAKHIIDKAKLTAKEVVSEGREKNKQAREDIKVRKAAVLAKAHERADEIVAKAKAHAEELVEKTNEDLAEAKEYIAQRHEVHNKLQDFYKSQSDFLSKRD